MLQLSRDYGVSRAGIIKHWDKEGVERDLLAKIQARAEALVTHDAVTPKVTPEQRVTERNVVEANAQVVADTILRHRADVKRAIDVVAVSYTHLDVYKRQVLFMAAILLNKLTVSGGLFARNARPSGVQKSCIFVVIRRRCGKSFKNGAGKLFNNRWIDKRPFHYWVYFGLVECGVDYVSAETWNPRWQPKDCLLYTSRCV